MSRKIAQYAFTALFAYTVISALRGLALMAHDLFDALVRRFKK